jgi:predicted Abi (CAAX) family protease
VPGTLLQRLSDAIATPPTGYGLGLSLALLAGYGAVIGPVGMRSGFLRLQCPPGPTSSVLRRLASLLLLPALAEELIFRVVLLPHPREELGPWPLTAWAALSVGLYVIYHPLEARLWYPSGRPLFDSPRFLVPCALLAVVLTISYQATGSIWPPVLIHWLVVLIWLELLGGRSRLGQRPQG